MKSIHDRWTECARAARTVTDNTPPAPPMGFAACVVRKAWARPAGSSVTETLDLWLLFARRGLALASVVVIVAGAVVWSQLPGSPFAAPTIGDDAIVQTLWQP